MIAGILAPDGSEVARTFGEGTRATRLEGHVGDVITPSRREG